MAGITLNFVNASNDANNSQVVIFEGSETLPGDFVTAWKMVQMEAGETEDVDVEDKENLYVAIVDTEDAPGDLIGTEAIISPSVPIKAGQTAYISGDQDSGYEISVSD
jgi:hypothetical protein